MNEKRKSENALLQRLDDPVEHLKFVERKAAALVLVNVFVRRRLHVLAELGDHLVVHQVEVLRAPG